MTVIDNLYVGKKIFNCYINCYDSSLKFELQIIIQVFQKLRVSRGDTTEVGDMG